LYKKAAHKILVKLTPGGSMVPTYVLQLLFSKKIQNCYKTQLALKQEQFTGQNSLIKNIG
jgi:hypothetical protein